MHSKCVKILQVFFFIATICIISCSSRCVVYAAEKGYCGDGLSWELSDNILEISGTGDMIDYSDGSLPPWYGVREEIKEIALPSEITTIGDYAFLGCSNVTSVTIPSKVTEIGDYSFAQCTGIINIDLGNVQKIGKGAFQECEALDSISFPDTLTSMASKAFYRCYGLQALTIPSSVTYMGSSTFAYCTGLVRANINIPMTELPRWMFYGCSSLTDISLAPNITSVGEYALHNCENLNGIYTESEDLTVVEQIKDSIDKLGDDESNGFVSDYKMPDSSSAFNEEKNVFTETEVIEKDGSVIVIEKETDTSEGISKSETILSVTVKDEEDWESISKELEKIENESVTVKVQLTNDKISGEQLTSFVGKNISLQMNTDDGVIWAIDMVQQSEKNFSGKYNLSALLIVIDAGKTQIASDEVYQVKFSDHIDFNTTVGIKVGKPNDFATLYEKKGGSYEIISTMVVDQDGYAWFSLAGIDKHAKYYIGLKVEGMSMESATIPQTMYDQYGIDEENSYLMDSGGMQYRITGRSSRWGITGKQFAIYVGVAIVITVLLVGSVMLAFNIIKKSREKYERMAEEEALKEKEEEEALRIEIMKELLGEEDDL